MTPSQTSKFREKSVLSAKELKKSSDDAWRNYSKKIMQGERSKWEDDFHKRFSAFNDELISPLAACHATWMKSEAMSNYFQCNYDVEQGKCGAVYTEVFIRCIAGTQDKAACFSVYEEWLSGDVGHSDNLLLRALVHNQKVVSDAIVKATKVNIDIRMFPWDNLFAVYSTAVGRVETGGAETASRVLVQVAGPLARAFRKVLDGNANFRQLIMMTGLISGQPIVLVQITGNTRAFRAHVVTELLRASGKVVDKRKLIAAVRAELRRLDIKGVPMLGTRTHAFMVPIDLEALRQISGTATDDEIIKKLAGSLRTVDDIERLDLGRWRQIISKDLAFGVVAGILQTLCLTKVFGDEDKVLENEKFDATWRLYMGGSALASTTAETIGKSLSARAQQGLIRGQGLVLGGGTFLRVVGRIGGVIAGLGMAVLDLRKFFESRKENQAGLSYLYLGAVFAGVALSYAIFVSMSIPVIGLLIALLVGIGLLIEYFKDNPVQDWLERTPWGILVDQRYPNVEVEQLELQQALKD